MAWIMPPIFIDGALPAPYHVRFSFEIPLSLLGATPAAAKWELQVAGKSIASGDAELVVEADKVRVYKEEVLSAVDWPQTAKIPSPPSVYTDVTELEVDSGVLYTGVYATAPSGGRVCINELCEETDIDGDGNVELAYLLRPTETARVVCEPSCTVLVFHAAILTRLPAKLVLTFYDQDGNEVGKVEASVETFEAPDFYPQGITLAPPKPAGITYPWCGAKLEPFQIPDELVQPPPSEFEVHGRVYNVRVLDWDKFSAFYAMHGGKGLVAGGVAAHDLDQYLVTPSLGCSTGGNCIAYGLVRLFGDAQKCSAQVPDQFVLFYRQIVDWNYIYTPGPGVYYDVSWVVFRNGGIAMLEWFGVYWNLENVLAPKGYVELDMFWLGRRQFIDMRPGNRYSVEVKPGETLIVEIVPSNSQVLVGDVNILEKATIIGDKGPVTSRLILHNFGDFVLAFWFYPPISGITTQRGQVDYFQSIFSGKGMAYFYTEHDWSPVTAEFEPTDTDLDPTAMGYIPLEVLYIFRRS